MKYFDKMQGYVNAGLYDKEAAFRVISNPDHYAMKIYEKDVKKLRSLFDQCDFDKFPNLDALELMRAMEQLTAGEIPIINLKSMGNQVKVSAPKERPKTAGDHAKKWNKIPKDIAKSETDIL